jgi:hypothetical protein
MPISYFINEEKKWLYSRATGLVTFDDFVAHMRAEFGRPSASYPEIFDCTGATTDLTAADIRLLVKSREHIANVQEAGPVAIVAPTDLFFGLFRIFDLMTEAIRPIRIFRNSTDAEAWLDSLAD